MYHIVNLVSPLLAENPRSHTRREREREREMRAQAPRGREREITRRRSAMLEKMAPGVQANLRRSNGALRAALSAGLTRRSPSVCVCVVETADAPRWVDRPFQSIARVCMCYTRVRALFEDRPTARDSTPPYRGDTGR